jgi:hypothetical protein
MGETNRLDSVAMEAIAEHLLSAASDIRFVGLDWPELQEDSATAAIDLHVESARLWAGSVVDRLEVWAQRARRIADALDRPRARRLT